MLGIARAQAYPSRPVRWVVGFAPGGGYDTVARLMGQWLQERLGQPFVIENRPGAATNIATEAVVRAAPDGYTLLLIGSTNAINATFYPKLNFNFIHDIAPVAGITTQPQVMLGGPSLSAKTISEVIAYAKANPGKYGVAWNRSRQSSRRRAVQVMAVVNLQNVPFGGNSPALTALLGGQVEISFASLPSAVEFIRTGKVKGLGVTTRTRSDVLPEVPSISEFVPGYDVVSWYGVGAPKGTPVEIIDKISNEVNAGVIDAKMKARLADLGGTPFVMSPAELSKFIAEDTEKWAKLIRAAEIKRQ